MYLSMSSVLNVLLIVLVHLPDHAYTKQPNIVLIVADDLGYQDVGFRGSDILTPNLDRLAGEGVILENHVVSSICSPSRATLLTGRYPIRTGFWKGNIKPNEEFGLGLDETLLPEMLKRNGYATHGVGKWHCGMHTWEHTPPKRGFDTYFGLFLGEQGYYSHKKTGKTDFRENFYDEHGNLVDDVRKDLKGQYNTYLFTNKSVELIQNHDQSKPFFLYLAYTAPHIPHEVPENEVEKYASHISLNKRKKYAAMVSVLDRGVGKVADALTQSGMMDNTILVFTSDNGAYYKSVGSNYPLRGGKSSFFEGGVRGVSFVYSSLLRKSGYTNTNLHHVTDWYATFQKLAGDKPEEHSKPQLPLDGVDIWASISDGLSCRDEILYELRDPSKRLDSSGHKGLKNARKHPISLKTLDMKFRKGDSRDAQDFFVIRWQNWKLLTGTGLEIQGWSPENGSSEYRNFVSYQGGMHPRSLVSGTFLFDLSTDIREEHNIADEYPDIVARLLDKRQSYLDKVKLVEERNYSKKGMVNGVWKPWVEL